MDSHSKLIFFCGKMAAGKTTLSRTIAEREGAIRLEQDELLDRLYPGEILQIEDFVKYSARLRDALAPHIVSLLQSGLTVVLDFPGNTRRQRAWFRQLIEVAGVEHELHYIDASDERCKRQLRERSAHLPAGTPWTSDEEFDAITAYFEPPSEEEGFTVVRHGRS